MTNYFCIFVTMFVILSASCSHRGMTLSEQIPSMHPEYNSDLDQVFLLGNTKQVAHQHRGSDHINQSLKKSVFNKKFPKVQSSSSEFGYLINHELLTISEKENLKEESKLYAH